MPRTDEITIDALVSGLVLAAALAIGLSVGVAPAFSFTRLRTLPLLRAGASSESRGSKRTRASLVSLEVALAVVLTIGAGLMLQSATDPVTYGVIAVATIGVVCAASVLPALRAVRVNPVEALRAG